MGWEATTNAATLGLGSRLSILETPQFDGVPPKTLPCGVDISIHFLGRGFVQARVLQASEQTAVIQIAADELCWRMGHLLPEEIGSDISMGDMHSQDWVITEQVECPGNPDSHLRR